MDCSICRTPLDADPSKNLERGKGDFIHVVCPVAPPAPAEAATLNGGGPLPGGAGLPVVLSPGFVERMDAAGGLSFPASTPDGTPSIEKFPGAPVNLRVFPFIESVADQKDWFNPGTGERIFDVSLVAGRRQVFPCPDLPTPVIRQYGALVYSGPPDAVRIRFKAGPAGKEFLDWTPKGHLEFQRIEEEKGTEMPVVVIPGEGALFEVENLLLTDVQFRLVICGFEGRQEE